MASAIESCDLKIFGYAGVSITGEVIWIGEDGNGNQKRSSVMEVVFWDWKAQPDLQELDDVISKFSRPAIIQIDTRGDQYAVVICERGTAKEVAQKAYEAWELERITRDLVSQGHAEEV